MSLEFSKKTEQEFQSLLQKYDTKRSTLLPTLYLAQEEFGHLSKEAMNYVAGRLEIPPAYVFEAVSFYVMFKQKDMGKFCVQVCDNITCHMMGSGEVLKKAKADLGLEHDEVSDDKTFSLKVVQCIGACDRAPAIQVNESFVYQMTAEKISSLIQELKEGKGDAVLREVDA